VRPLQLGVEPDETTLGDEATSELYVLERQGVAVSIESTDPTQRL
jgi:hypothetical protein